MVKKKKRACESWFYLIVAEVAFYFFFWYGLWLLEVNKVNVWAGALVLFVLINIAIWACPYIRKVCKA